MWQTIAFFFFPPGVRRAALAVFLPGARDAGGLPNARLHFSPFFLAGAWLWKDICEQFIAWSTSPHTPGRAYGPIELSTALQVLGTMKRYYHAVIRSDDNIENPKLDCFIDTKRMYSWVNYLFQKGTCAEKYLAYQVCG